MVQSFNFQGIIQAFRVMASPRLMIPNLVVRDIRDINFAQLHKAGIRAIAFDKDNCLTRPYGNDLYPPFEDAWKQCKGIYKDKIVIVSNSAGTHDDKEHKGAIEIENSLGVHVLRHKEKKPAGGEELLEYLDPIPPSQIAFVGDRALTDIVFGHNYGMLTILTRQVVSEKGDNPIAMQIRRLEHRVLDLLERMNIRPTEHEIPVDPKQVLYRGDISLSSKEQ
ncbi:hypothetical protein BG004_007759 [Podila humilis]|nr:hypothetical protein BG004_007759 [Podila humilis]